MRVCMCECVRVRCVRVVRAHVRSHVFVRARVRAHFHFSLCIFVDGSSRRHVIYNLQPVSSEAKHIEVIYANMVGPLG